MEAVPPRWRGPLSGMLERELNRRMLWPRGTNPAPPGIASKDRRPNLARTLRREAVQSIRELKMEAKNGSPGLNVRDDL